MKRVLGGLFLIASLAVTGMAHEGHGAHDEAGEAGSKTITVKGEVLDMACYLDHGATGAKHADCAQTCIKSGLPVGLKADNGKTYLLIGEHEAINEKLAAYGGKTVTLRGKEASRDGINLLENVEVVQ